jgi:aarF domain-containing kinase
MTTMMITTTRRLVTCYSLSSALLLLAFSLLSSTGNSSAFVPRSASRRAFVKSCSISTGASLSAVGTSDSSSQTSQQQRGRKKKTLQDRSQQETISLIQDVMQAVAEAGPRAGPRRTFQAQRAFFETAREFLPQLLSSPPKETQTLAPKVMRTLFERLGATYIKLGQFIASSPTLFPKEYVLEFQKCLDQTNPLPWATIKKVIEDELGPIGKTFSYIDPKPLASASIAQVHVARLASTKEDVVIKVQKPRIDESLKADLGFLYVAARVLEFLQPDWERTSLSAVAGDVRSSMLEELDFVKEAQNTIQFRRFLQDYNLLDQATAPRVYLDYTTKKVLTMERLNGVSMLDEKAIAQQLNSSNNNNNNNNNNSKKTSRGSGSVQQEDGTQTIITALNIWSLSVTAMPWFHADVHAGNLLLLDDGRVGFIDFGIVGKISEKVFASVNELSVALAVGDSTAMAQALCNMGAADAEVDVEQFGRDIERVIQSMNQVQPEIMVSTNTSTAAISVDETEITNLLLELVEVTEANGLKLPREFGLLVKQSLYFDRYLKILAPNVDVMSDSRVMIGGGAAGSKQAKNGTTRKSRDGNNDRLGGGRGTRVNGDKQTVIDV